MSESNSFEANGRKFKLSKINALKQFHIMRRIAPIIAEFMPALASMASDKVEAMSEKDKLNEFAKVATPLMDGLSKLSDKDSEYVLYRLLSSVEVFQDIGNGVWVPVANDTQIIMQDIELPVLLQVAGRALGYNLSGFFALLPRK